jgi:hypothetical protein
MRGIDILEDESMTYFTACLCGEAGVCKNYTEEEAKEAHETGTPIGNPILIEQAIYNIDDGLCVKDRDGAWFRLKVTAEPITVVEEPMLYRCLECGRLVEVLDDSDLPRSDEYCDHQFERV